jgi:hypothetical protein
MPVAQDFADLEPYAPVKPLDVLAAEIGVPEEELAKLDANENLYGPLPEVGDALANWCFNTPSALSGPSQDRMLGLAQLNMFALQPIKVCSTLTVAWRLFEG